MATRLTRTYWICPKLHQRTKHISWVIEQEHNPDGSVLRDRDISISLDRSLSVSHWYELDINGYGYIKPGNTEGWEEVKKCKLKKLTGIKTWTLD